MQTRRSNTQARVEFVQNLVLLAFVITAWATCLSAYVWANGETPESQFDGKVWTLILGAVLFFVILWEVWKTSPVHLHIVWHRHHFVAEIDEHEPELPSGPEVGRRWMQHSGLLDADAHPQEQTVTLDPNA